MKTPEGQILLKTPEGKAWKYKQLIARTPDKTLDLSDLLNAQHVVEALQIIAAKYPGHLCACERVSLIVYSIFQLLQLLSHA